MNILIVIIFLLLILLVCLRLLFVNDYPRKNQNKIKFTTGDILFNSYNRYVSFMTQSVWTHVGIIIVEDDEIKVLDLERKIGRPKIMTLTKWIKNNKINFLGLRKINRELDNQDIYDQYNKLSNIKYKTIDTTWKKYMLTRKYSGILRREMMCSEYIIEILQRINIVKKDLDSSSFLPKDLAYNIPTEKGYCYKDIVKISI